jgi:Rps23 Pro-64 3,4-dihydroxylase Tpa1-like proline 4-hydroxylase
VGKSLTEKTTQDLLTFSISEMADLGRSLSLKYNAAEPWPHVVIDDFLPENLAQNILNVFPNPEHEAWIDWTKRSPVNQFKKQGIGSAAQLETVSPYLQHVLSAFQSYPFLNFLQHLTSIPKLLPDPYLYGGGIHQILTGGKLKVHADFNLLPRLDLYRRINVILYLNEDWKPEYNGDFELWDSKGQACIKSVAPLFNRMVVFNTDKRSLHGHPKPLNTPPDVTRKSLAFYYYTATPEVDAEYDKSVEWHET